MCAAGAKQQERANAISEFAATHPNGGLTIVYRHTTRLEGYHEDVRTLSHLHVFLKNGEHYVAADDDLSGERRTFLLSRLQVICSYEDMAKVSNGH